ncbi:MAG TPA: hypothetical protein VF618_02440 [Thermoanaerobaculia bacterium]
MDRSLVRGAVFGALARRGIDLSSLHRRTRIAVLITEPSDRRDFAEELTGKIGLSISASQLDYKRVSDLIVYSTLPGKSTTKPSGGD